MDERMCKDYDWICGDESQDARTKINGPWVAILNEEIIASATSMTTLYKLLDTKNMCEKPVFHCIIPDDLILFGR